MDCYCWIVARLTALNGLKPMLQGLGLDAKGIRWIFGTHGYYDHVGAAAEWKALSGGQLYLHHEDMDQVEAEDNVRISASHPRPHSGQCLLRIKA